MGLKDKLAKAGNRRWVLGCVGLLFLCGFGGAIAVLQVVDFPVVANRADAVVAEYKAAGLPWEQGDLGTHLPDDRNGAADFQEAIRLAGGSLNKHEKVINELMQEKKWTEISAILRMEARVLESLRKASVYGGLDFDRDWDKGSHLLFPEFSSVTGGVRLLTYNAESAARNGDLELALSDLKSAYRLGCMIGKEPILIAMLVGISNQKTALECAVKIAALRPDDQVWIARVRKELEGWECQVDFMHAMRGEAYMGLATIRNVKGEAFFAYHNATSATDYDSFFYDDAHRVRTGLPSRLTNKAFAVRWMEAQMHLLKVLGPEGINKHRGIREFEQYIFDQAGPPKKLSNTVNETMFPVFDGVAADIAPFRLEATKAVLRAAEFRAKVGRYPKSLGEMGVMLQDPLVDQGARYLVQGKEVTVYSIGRNGKDDLGERFGVTRGDDEGMRFPPRPKKSASSIAVPVQQGAPVGGR